MALDCSRHWRPDGSEPVFEPVFDCTACPEPQRPGHVAVASSLGITVRQVRTLAEALAFVEEHRACPYIDVSLTLGVVRQEADSVTYGARYVTIFRRDVPPPGSRRNNRHGANPRDD